MLIIENSLCSIKEGGTATTTTTSHWVKREKIFRNIVNKAAKQNIPSGRIQNVLNAVPTETTKLMEERDWIRSEDPADRIKILNSQINQSIKDHRKEKWLDHLKSCGPGTKKLWDTIKSLNNHPKQPGNQSIRKIDKEKIIRS